MRPVFSLSRVDIAADDPGRFPPPEPPPRQPVFVPDAVERLTRVYKLSAGEKDVVLLAALRGASMKEAAAELGKSRKTVEQCWRRIYRKTGCQSQLEVIAELLRVAGEGRPALAVRAGGGSHLGLVGEPAPLPAK